MWTVPFGMKSISPARTSVTIRGITVGETGRRRSALHSALHSALSLRSGQVVSELIDLIDDAYEIFQFPTEEADFVAEKKRYHK